ncbi:TEPP-like protein [Mya arenaria]|uniref:TEPP-like protein n=1 Tax=Mya arenaria TaxID=6604 RepID=A0ABY7EWM8_MYAAR|nr:TEPP-like protein [Mya arenaria]
MTTVGVDPVKIERVNPMNIPSYSYQYPSFQRVQLAAVKEGLFHPRIPSFRRMDMDTAGHKLPDEHCRTTTMCGPVSQAITNTGKQIHRQYTTPDELKRSRTEWSNFLNRSPERFNIKLPDMPTEKDQRFVGYAVRYLRPEVTKSWSIFAINFAITAFRRVETTDSIMASAFRATL